ncbi:MAG: Cytosol aminopeptidase [Owenweeksia sp. TMED14]|nr:MAG: Cytosol aminopeptidase [Owenweeksia sp. TMED14]
MRSNFEALRETELDIDQCKTIISRSARKLKGWTHFVSEKNDVFGCVLGEKSDNNHGKHALRNLGKDLADYLGKNKVNSVSVDAGAGTFWIAEGLFLASYRYNKLFGKTAEQVWSLKEIEIIGLSKRDFQKLSAIFLAVNETRDLVNSPLLTLTAEILSSRIEELGNLHGFSTTIFNQAKIETLKMGGLLSVNKGSIDPATFSILEHKPKNAVNKRPYILVGKGVVYDTGGLSLKPSGFMDTMKCDMAGGAAVVGAFCALAIDEVPTWVIGLIPATDNRPGGNAITPGDVIKISDGTTVEVLNTDAEGRLILADALHYAKKYDPKLVIDLATLTGSAAKAIGPNAIVAMGNAEDKIWDRLIDSGESSHERLVRFPFWEEYNDLLKSEIADLKNIGGAEAGMITAGKFLEHFTDYPYVHLDIAGPAFLEKNHGYYGKGGTGIGVRLLYDFLSNVKS